MTLERTVTTFSIRIPLILLGSEKIVERFNNNESHHAHRLDIVHEALKLLCPDISVQTWLPREYVEGKGVDKLSGVDDSKRRQEWAEIEKQRWEACERSASWILQLTDPNDTLGACSLGIFKNGYGHVSPAEEKLASDEVWTCAFLLQKNHIEVQAKPIFAQELEAIFKVLDMISSFDHPEFGRLLRIVKGEMCWSHVVFRLENKSTGESVPWDESTCGNILVLMTAFEREIMTLYTPSFLLGNWSLTHFLMQRAVRLLGKRVEKMQKTLLRNETQDEESKRVMWKEGMDRLLNEIKWEDERIHERQTMLGEERKEWWEAVVEEGFVRLIRDMLDFERRFGGLLVNFGSEVVGQEPGEMESNNANGSDSPTTPRPAKENTPSDDLDLYTQSSPSFQDSPNLRISSITFPLPPAPLFALIDLLSQLLHQASHLSLDTLSHQIHYIRSTCDIPQPSPVRLLQKLAVWANVDPSNVKILKDLLGEYWEDEVQSGLPWDEALSKFLKGEPDVLKLREMEANSWNRATGGEDEKSGRGSVFTPTSIPEHIEKSLIVERMYMPHFLERYGSVGGFCVPEKMKVWNLLMKERDRRGASQKA